MKKCTIITLLPVGLVAFLAISNTGINILSILVILTFIAMVIPYVFFASDAFLGKLNNWIKEEYWKNVFLIGLLFVIYFLYVIGTGSFPVIPMVKTIIYIGFPLVILITLKETKQHLVWQDFLVIIAIWFPIEFDWLNLRREGTVGIADNIITQLLAIDTVLFIFLLIRRLQGIGYTYSLKKKDIFTILGCYMAIGIIVIPIGLATDFLGWTPHLPRLGIVVIEAIGIFFAVGLTEELLFRGIIHNLIQKSLKNYRFGLQVALLISSVIFGAAHLNNMGGGDMRYFFLATIAGGFYGLAYIRSGNIVPAAFVHTLIDLTWVLFFSK